MSAEKSEFVASKSNFTNLLASGLAGWVVGTLGLLGVGWFSANPQTFSLAVVWAISHCWIAFAFGAVVLILRGVMSGASLGAPLLAYLLPAAVLTAVVGICQLVYPDQGFREDLLSYLPLVLPFYLIGLAWAAVAKEETRKAPLIRAVIPALLGGLIILGMVAVPVFNSNAFVYHNAFDLKVSKRDLQQGVMTADAVLEIRKPGTYAFSVPRYTLPELEGFSAPDFVIEYGTITWGAAGEPKTGLTGVYPLQIRWQKNVHATGRELLERGLEEEPVTMQIHDPASKETTPLVCIYAEVPGANP